MSSHLNHAGRNSHRPADRTYGASQDAPASREFYERCCRFADTFGQPRPREGLTYRELVYWKNAARRKAFRDSAKRIDRGETV